MPVNWLSSMLHQVAFFLVCCFAGSTTASGKDRRTKSSRSTTVPDLVEVIMATSVLHSCRLALFNASSNVRGVLREKVAFCVFNRSDLQLKKSFQPIRALHTSRLF